ncbi:hypothetical protein DFH09DRAFT_1353917 [Mycena vulgaris]|nr:hypothetical protein DFH09DRAFT_1353917 [Mycena vulgaris]
MRSPQGQDRAVLGTRAIRIYSPGIGPAVPATLPRARRAFRAARARAQGCERREEGTGFCESGRDAPRITGACGRLRAERAVRPINTVPHPSRAPPLHPVAVHHSLSNRPLLDDRRRPRAP